MSEWMLCGISGSICNDQDRKIYSVDEDEIEELEDRTHRFFADPKPTGLNCYWSNFEKPGEKYLAFLGKTLAILGVENLHEASFTEEDIRSTMESVIAKLAKLGYEETPKIYLQWMPDA